jgi:two-component system, sporulation sensor kinase E
MYCPQQSKAVTFIGWLSAVAGLTVMAGWLFNMPGLQSTFPHYLSMKFNTALLFTLVGAALLLTQLQIGRFNNLIFILLSSVIALTGLLTLLQYPFHINLGIDQLFYVDKQDVELHWPYPGRMAANVCLCFGLIGLAFMGFCSKNRVVHLVAQYFLHLTTLIAAIALIGYLYGLSLFYSLSSYNDSMAIHTAILMFIVSISATLIHPSVGVTGLFTGNRVGHQMSRRTFGLLVIMVVVFGLLRLPSQHFGWLSEQESISMLAVGFIAANLVIIWYTASWLNKVDVQRSEAEEQIKQMNEHLEEKVEERTQALTELLEKYSESKSKFRAAFKFSAIGMALVSLDGYFLKANKRFCDMIGYTEQELLKKSFLDVTHPDDMVAGFNVLKKVGLGENIPHRTEKRYLNKNGETVWAAVNMATVNNNNDKPLYLVSQIEDITERKMVEQQLKKSEEKYHSLIEQASDAIYLLDFEGNFTDANESMCKMTGYTRDELLQKHIEDIIDPEQLKTDPVIFGYPEPEATVIRERRLVRKDGEIFAVEINVKRFPDNTVLVIARDVSDRKRMEADLREAELKFRTIAEKSMVGVYISQGEKFIYVNPRFAEIFGYEQHELINTKESAINKIISEEGQALVSKNVFDRYKGEVENAHYEVMGKRKDSTYNYVEFYGSRVIIDGKPSIIGTMLDITERRRAEEVLIRSEANLKTIMDTTDTAYALLDKDLNIMAYNQMSAKFVNNQSNHQPLKGDKLSDYFPDEQFPQFIAYAQDVLKGRSISYEVNYPQPDGAVFWFYLRLFPIANDKNEIFGLMLALSDITERKYAEENLKTAYNLVQEHIDSIKEMAWKQSHLIRSPVANLKGLAMMLNADPTDTEVLKFINMELERLDSVIIEMAEDASSHDI